MKDYAMQADSRWRGVVVGMLMLAAGAVAVAPPAHAGTIGDSIQIHGYGSWAYKRVSNEGYLYAEGEEEGNYTNVSGTLNVSAQPAENLMTVIQANWTLMQERTPVIALVDTGTLAPPPFTATGTIIALPTGAINSNPTNSVELDYAFAEWRFNDALRLRAGQVKLPFGIYTEIWDVGTLRPFLDLPQALYGGQAVVAEAYQGGGLTGNLSMGDWGLLYDAYVGQVISDLTRGPATIDRTKLSDVFGARLHFTTPIDGVSVGASGYFGLKSDGVFTIPGIATRAERASGGVHVEYAGDALVIRAEGVYTYAQRFYDAIAGYGEISYLFMDHLQVAARVDFYKSDFANWLKPLIPTSSDEHVDYGVGLNYWFGPNFVIKTAYHYVRGNRYSLPTNLEASVNFMTPYTGPPLDESNHLFEAGAQFSF